MKKETKNEKVNNEKDLEKNEKVSIGEYEIIKYIQRLKIRQEFTREERKFKMLETAKKKKNARKNKKMTERKRKKKGKQNIYFRIKAKIKILTIITKIEASLKEEDTFCLRWSKIKS